MSTRHTKTRFRSLTNLMLKPTLYCYHKCPYCNLRQSYYQDIIASTKQEWQLLSMNDTPINNPGHIPLDTALHAIDDAAALGMKTLQLSGGDPLLYPQLLELIRGCARHPGVLILMNSVGTNVTVEKARAIIEAGLGAWNFSVDTLDEVKYDQLRGIRGALAMIMKAVETVREAAADRPEFSINYMTVITRHNFRDLPGLLRHCVDTRVASIYLMNVYGDSTGELLLNELDIQEFREHIAPLMLAVLNDRSLPDIVQKNAAEVIGTFFSADNSDSNYAQGNYWPDMASVRQACDVPNYYALIEPDGRVLPCCLVEISHEGEVGTVAHNSLRHVWNSDSYVNFRRERIAFCQKCPTPRNKALGLIPKMCRQFNE